MAKKVILMSPEGEVVSPVVDIGSIEGLEEQIKESDFYKELSERLAIVEELLSQIDDRIQDALDNYPLRTVCSYPLRGTGNIRVVAASSLDS